jgi:hypothetical protein
MNDLERDLQELFERRAAGVDVPGLAPKPVLRRGRRRQIGAVVGGAIACLVALGVAAAAIGQARHPAVIPGGNGLPARSTTIGGVPVTAPAGWTLVDDWPLAAILPTTSQTCSFSATGAAIDGNGSPVDAVPSVSPIDGGSGEGTSSGQACTQENLGTPAGVPVLQLANFEVPVMETVCGLSDQEAPAPLPDDGVAVYVGAFPGGVSTQALTDACPGADNVTSGPVVETFADRGVQIPYAAVVVAGAGASSEDIGIAQDYARSLGGLRVDPTAPASAQGPGYVLAAGRGGDTSWRLEAGITSFDRQDGTPVVGAVMVTTDPSGEGSRTVDLPTDRPVNDDYVDLASAGVVQFGTASGDVTGIDVVDASGHAQPVTLLPWPTGLATLQGTRMPSGWLWFAGNTQRGDVRPTLASAPTPAPSASAPSAKQLQTRTDPDGSTVVYGHDLGHDWEIRRVDNSFELFLDGSTTPIAGSFSAALGASTQVDVGGGTFVIGIEDQTVQSFDVTTDATDQTPSTTIVGRWTAVRDGLGEQGRLWVLALPGSGTGLQLMRDDLPTFVSWPSNPLRDGSLIAGGSDGVVSWGLSWRNDHCIVLKTLGADPGNSGTSACLPPWSELKHDPLVGGFYGSTRSTSALVVTHRPATTVTSPDLNDGDLQCVDMDFESNFAGTTICVFPVEVGHPVTINVSQSAGPLNDAFTIEAEPGRTNLIQTDPTPTP